MNEIPLPQELKNIDSVIFEMLEDVINYYNIALIYFKDEKKYDPKLEFDDDKINNLERKVEEMCLSILLREKVYSIDLRRVSGNLKLVEDIERIGDQVWDILHISHKIKLTKESYLKIKEMDQIISVVTSMLNDVMKCLVNEDVSLANDILQRDDIVDEYFENILNEIIDLNKKEKLSSNNTVYLTLIDKYFERIADQITNIAEWIIYIINGFHKDQVII